MSRVVILRAGIAAWVFLLTGAVASRGANAPEADSPQISQLLSNVKNEAALLRSDLSTLDFFVLPDTGPRAYPAMLDLYVERAGRLRSQAAKLITMREDASRWQRFSIDKVVPLIQELASDAETAVTASRNPGNLAKKAEFRAYLKARSNLANELYTLIGAWVDYGKTRQDIDRYRATIEAPAS